MTLDIEDKSLLTNLTDVTNKVKNEVVKLITINKYLIKIIESALNFKPPVMKYQLEFLEKIDEQLAAGQTESSFWKDKLVKQISESK